MRILVVGGGGREHAIVWKLSQSPKVDKLYCAPGNGGIAALAECIDIKATDLAGVTAFAMENAVDLVVVAPDDPLAAGMVDALEQAGIRAFGPRKAAAELEASKAFAKELMKKYSIPTAGYAVFDNSAQALEYVGQCSFPTVVKADGLALGKGVVIANTLEEATSAIKDMMDNKVFGEAGRRIIIEEFMTGPEVSVLAFTDGKTVIPMVSSQDHKRAYDHDLGPNTGGMGTFSPSRIYTSDIAAYCMEHIYIPTIRAMESEGRTFQGVLYFGLMLTEQGPRVLEYNARFGDPETQVVLPRLQTDLLDIFLATIEQRLDRMNVEWNDNAAVCVILASGGYPGRYATGYAISGLDTPEEDIMVFHAGTRKENDSCVTAGGRVLGVTAVADTLDRAIERSYAAVQKIHFQDMHYRRDIGRK